MLAVRLPTPKPGHVLGLVGTNGIGKSTALKILAGKLKPNLGRFEVCVLAGNLFLSTPSSLFLMPNHIAPAISEDSDFEMGQGRFTAAR